MPGRAIVGILDGTLTGDARALAEWSMVQPVLQHMEDFRPHRMDRPCPLEPERAQQIRADRSRSPVDQAALLAYSQYEAEHADLEQQNIRRLASLLFAHRVCTQMLQRDPAVGPLLESVRVFLIARWGIASPPVGARYEREVADRMGRLVTRHGIARTHERAAE